MILPNIDLLNDGIQFRVDRGFFRYRVCSSRTFRIIAEPAGPADAALRTIPLPSLEWLNPENAGGDNIAGERSRECEPWELRSDRDHHIIATKQSRLKIRKADGGVRLEDLKGNILVEEIPSSGRECFEPACVEGEQTWHASIGFHSPKDEYILGFGQYQDGLWNRKGVYTKLAQFNTTIALPCWVSSRGYGAMINNPSMIELNPERTAIDFWIEASIEKHWARFTTREAGTYSFAMEGLKLCRDVSLTVGSLRVIDHDYDVIPDTLCGTAALEANREYVIKMQGKVERLTVRYPSQAETLEIEAEVADSIDYFLCAGSPSQAVGEFRRLTGAAPLLPKWAFGFLQSRYTYNTQESMLAVAAEYRRRRIPLDVVVQDMNYWTATREFNPWGSHRFDPGRYPDPKNMFNILKNRFKVRTLVSVWPRVNRDSDTYEPLRIKGYLLETQTTENRGAEGIAILGEQENAPLDPWNPKARWAFWDYIKERLLDLGADAFWLDATEPEWGYDFRKAKTFAGSGARNLNTYSLLFSKAIWEGMRRDSDKRVFMLTRSAFPGQQRYGAAAWSGDLGLSWDTYRKQIPAGLSFGLAGQPWWTHDIGGFRPFFRMEDPSWRELLVRWFQFGTFSPLMRVHGCRDTEIWQTGPSIERILSGFIRLRYRLMPYIYSSAAAASLDHTLLMRPMAMDNPEDPRAWAIWDQYRFGPNLLVCPVLHRGERKRMVYFPADTGPWYDFYDDTQYAASGSEGQTIQVPAPLKRIPLFVPAGSIIPMGKVRQYLTGPQSLELTIRVYPGKDGVFTLYEDEGEKYGYESGACSRIPFKWDESDRKLCIGRREGSFPGMKLKRKLRVIVAGEPEVKVDYIGEELHIPF